jgi:diguanylate cyclase (GGDEF)-like protein
LGTDIKLLGYVASALFFFMAFMLLLTLRHAVRVRGATYWVWSTVTVAIGIGLNTSQEHLPPFLGIGLANVLIIAGAALGACGTYAYRYEKTPDLRWLYGAAAALTAVFMYLESNLAARVLLVAFLTIAICSTHAWLMLAGSRLRPNNPRVMHKRFRLPHAVMVIGLLTIVFVFSIRAIDTLATLKAAPGAIPPGGPTRTAFAFYALGLAGRLLLLIGMVLLLIDELDQKLRALALRDSLTGLFNRRGLIDTTATLPLKGSSMLMLDLDHFKAVNDDFGHDQGDRVIALLARCAQAHLPANAVLARLGGEEFCALLPDTNAEVARTSAESLRAAFHRETAALAHPRQHTVSIGVASMETAEFTLAELTERADQALYRAKHEGRNRVEVAGGVA